MKRFLFKALAAPAILCSLSLFAQEDGNWRAANQTAKSITGDIGITAEKLYINFVRFPIARIRPLKPEEISAAFEADANSAGSGSLYRLSIAPETKFLHKNTICGSQETQWMATYVEGKTLKVAFFSNATPPVFTLDAIQNSTDLCGTYAYVK
jgi:hypothetical protein